MNYLSTAVLSQRGDFHSMISEATSNLPKLLAVVWVNRERRYFIFHQQVLQLLVIILSEQDGGRPKMDERQWKWKYDNLN